MEAAVMTNSENESTPAKPLRLWPGVALVVLQWVAWLGVPRLLPDAAMYGVLAGLAAGPAVLAWWAFASRAPRVERWGAAVLMILALAATRPLLHESVAEGNMGFQFYLYAIPVLSLAFVVWAVAARGLPAGPRRAAMVATILLACGAWTLVRSKGLTGDGFPEFAWRWSQTAEERLLAQAGGEPAALPRAPAASARAEPDWPG
ncbi:MAG: DUF4175 domain-containing protein, partial [Acidobacteriota bacterium]|nr:DUF4175 domain-containing protein [Acidobacteriota bacterium]